MTTTYDLERTTPDGRVSVQRGYPTKRMATVAASFVLYNNGAASKAEAQMLAGLLGRTPLGQPITAYGYTFRVVRVAS